MVKNVNWGSIDRVSKSGQTRARKYFTIYQQRNLKRVMKKAIFIAFLILITTNLYATVKENAQLFLPPVLIAGMGAIGITRLAKLLPDAKIQNLFGFVAGTALQIGANWVTHKINDDEIISLERRFGIAMFAAMAVFIPFSLEIRSLEAYDMALLIGTCIGAIMSLHIFEND
jgi:hypothetical protein